jgi:hypothetical protein
MNGTRERRREGTIARANSGELDGLLYRAQAGILAKITSALDLRAGLAAITAGFAAGQPVAGNSDDVEGQA